MTTKLGGDLILNYTTKRCIDVAPDGKTATLFTFDRPDDEVYHYVRQDVPLKDAQAWLTNREPEPEPQADPLIEHPPIIVYERDLNRLRSFAVKHGYADSAYAFRKLLEAVGE